MSVPRFQLLSGGNDLTAQAADRLVSLEVVDAAGVEADRFRIVFDDRDQRIKLPRTGAELRLRLGIAELFDVGTFAVDSVAAEAGPVGRITVTARSVDLNTGIRAPRSRTWANTTLGKVAEQLAGFHRLTLRIDAGLAAHPYEHLEQSSESDLHLLTRLARDLDALAKVVDGQLVIAPQGTRLAISGRRLPEVAIAGLELTGWAFRVGERQLYNACRARWGNRKAADQPNVLEGSGEPIYELRRVYATEAEARAAARRKLAALQKSKRALVMDVAGFRGEIAAGTPLAVTGLREEIDGTWMARRVTHTLNSSGLLTQIEAAPPDEEDTDT